MRLALIVIGVLLSPLASAEIYRWVDAEGGVHFGARPQPGAERVEVRPPVIDLDEATRERRARSDRYFDARRQERAVPSAAQAKQVQRRQACEQMRDRLSQLSLGGRYFSTDAKGERVYYSDEELGAARQQLASRIDQNCS